MSEEQIKEQTDEIEEVDTVAETDGAEEQQGNTADPTLEEQLDAARAEAAKNMDGWLRAQAEFANARKRFEKDRMLAYGNATADVIRKLLPIIDDFERAMENAPDEISSHDWYGGIELVQRKLNNLLEHFNVEPLDAKGEPFDPNMHEALSQEPSDEYDSGMVIRELQKGYKVGERVIRPSLVVVAE